MSKISQKNSTIESDFISFYEGIKIMLLYYETDDIFSKLDGVRLYIRSYSKICTDLDLISILDKLLKLDDDDLSSELHKVKLEPKVNLYKMMRN